MDKFKSSLVQLMTLTRGFNTKEQKVIIWHPLGLLVFILIMPGAIITCIFMGESIFDYFDLFTFKNNKTK